MSDSILNTKITPPLTGGPQLLFREELVEKIHTGLNQGKKLILLSAPAGAGKTTLLTCWAQKKSPPLAWLSLDKADNDFHRFWYYILAALASFNSDLGQEGQIPLQAAQTVSGQTVVTSVLNDLSNLQTPLILVIDDYHFIHAEEIHESLNLFIDRLPPHFHLIISTREDPPLAIARWRASLALTEIRFSDLQFSSDETGKLLNEIMDFGLSAQDVSALEQRTEGWIVGLRMAALSLENLSSSARQEFIKNFTGDDRFIVDYVVEDVLKKLSEDTLLFLVKTSLLDRFTASLCDAVMESAGSAEQLKGLEEANLFLISLDHQRHWFRYHHLFSDLLRSRVGQYLSMAEVSQVYKKASAWHEKNGYIEEAVAYAFETKDYNYITEVIEENILITFYRSETRLVCSWLKALPVTILRRRPLLAGVYAGCLLLSNEETVNSVEGRSLVEEWLGYAEEALAAQVEPVNKRVERITSHYIDKIRAYLARYRGEDPATIIALTDRALARLPKGEEMFRSALWHNLGLAYRDAGEVDSALKAFEQARKFGEKSKDFFNLASSLNHLAVLNCKRGDLLRGLEICKQGLNIISRLSGGGTIPYAGNIYITLGSIYGEWLRFEEGLEIILHGLELLELTNSLLAQERGYIERAYIKHFSGDTDEALDDLLRVRQAFASSETEIEAHWAAISLLAAEENQDYLENALRWAYNRRPSIENSRLSQTGLIFARLNYFQLTTEQPVNYLVKLRALLQSLTDYLSLAREKNSCR